MLGGAEVVICGFEITQIVTSLGYHFLLSASVGWLVYWLTWTISGDRERRTRLSLSLAFALVAHVVEDYFVGWF